MSKGLQSLNTAELEVLLESLEGNAARASELLFPDRPPGYEKVLQHINEWAVNRKVVLENRANGRGHVAIIFEKVCYRIWQQLPGYVHRLRLNLDPETGTGSKSGPCPCDSET